MKNNALLNSKSDIRFTKLFTVFLIHSPSDTKLKSNVGEAAFVRRSEGVDRPTLSKAHKNNEACD